MWGYIEECSLLDMRNLRTCFDLAGGGGGGVLDSKVAFLRVNNDKLHT